MSERGVFAVDRGIWTDPDFAAEPLTEREAFLWLVGEAAWRKTRVRVGSATIELERGQCAFSTRFMASRWQWSEARVRRFLGRLTGAQMISTVTDTRATQVTIVKYNRFQRVSLPDDHEATQERRGSDAGATQERRKEEDRETKVIPPSPPKGGSASKPKLRQGTRLVSDWRPSDHAWSYAVEKLGSPRAQSEFEHFQDHFLARDGPEAFAVDWDARWRTWVRNALKFDAKSASSYGANGAPRSRFPERGHAAHETAMVKFLAQSDANGRDRSFDLGEDFRSDSRGIIDADWSTAERH